MVIVVPTFSASENCNPPDIDAVVSGGKVLVAQATNVTDHIK